jgi:dCMP deaminase
MRDIMTPHDDDHFLQKARETSLKSPCFKSKVGAIIVKHGEILVEGFNTAPENQKNCAEIGFCYRIANNIQSGTEPTMCRAAGCHAEMNAISRAARHGIKTDQATMYVHGNTEICLPCRAQITTAGIVMVVYESKFGEIEHVNVKQDWSIHPIDYDRVFDEWSRAVN